ncbi:MAG: hypothetical protein EOP10_26875 [Proteobacteria bacterium]|nr:MAG: hypothetical protein EOP10_26875 [Pseudomonadota bacterium]
MVFGKTLKGLFLTCLLAELTPVFAKNSSELIYAEPFDLAAGGSVLTRASQEGVLFGNPALLPLGGAYIRWIGLETNFILDRDLAEQGQKAFQSPVNTDNSAYIDKLFNQSIHLGQSASLSVVSKNFAISLYDRLELDVEGSRYDNGGLPTINFGGEAYAGAMVSSAIQPLDWFSIGMTTKYLYMGEPDIKIPITDTTRLEQLLDDPSSLKDEVQYGKGIGTDIGTLFLWQNRFVDLSLGVKVEDMGGTKLSNNQESLPQTTHVGVGLAFHGMTNVLHLSLDYRDVTNEYQEKKFKKIYAGARLMLFQHVGLAVGLYQGIPTCGVRLDAFFIKLGITAYGRELGNYPGDKQRNLVSVYTSIGF